MKFWLIEIFVTPAQLAVLWATSYAVIRGVIMFFNHLEKINR